MGPISKMPNTEMEAMIFAAKYYSLHLDSYIYDILSGNVGFCNKHSFFCKLILATYATFVEEPD